VPETRLRVAIVGCGDVAHRSYLPPLIELADRAEVVGCCSSRMESAELAVAAVRNSSPGATAFDRLDEMLTTARPDAVFNLTPAPVHGEITSACLAAGAHVYSEKPLAASLEEADRLIAEARAAGVLLLCAPASAATRQLKWLREIVDSGSLGRPTLATAMCAGMGPASWAEYTGDPTVFYGPGVGPLRDLGIYRLHEMTALLGPVRRVSAVGKIAIPERTIVAGPRAGQTLTVTSPDHVLIDMEFAGGALGQLLSSFAVPDIRAPRLEIHFTQGSISMTGDQFIEIPADVFALSAGRSAAGRALAQGRNDGLLPPQPPDRFPTVSLGVEHFLACIAGVERPILTAEHARHTLEIVLAAYESIADGRPRDLRTTF
jgi:predicted dehydrogenase